MRVKVEEPEEAPRSYRVPEPGELINVPILNQNQPEIVPLQGQGCPSQAPEPTATIFNPLWAYFYHPIYPTCL